MIKFEKFGKTVKIRNDDWKKLRERLDVKKAGWNKFHDAYRIEADCPLCSRYTCPSCPFYVFKVGGKGVVACVQFLRKLLKPMYINPGSYWIAWSKRINKLARKQLGQLLKMMDKIEASQGGKNDKKSKN